MNFLHLLDRNRRRRRRLLLSRGYTRSLLRRRIVLVRSRDLQLGLTSQSPIDLILNVESRELPNTVAKTTGMTMNSRNSGSNTPPFLFAILRHTISDSFPAIEDPNMPPRKGAMYNNPTLKGSRLYGLRQHRS